MLLLDLISALQEYVLYILLENDSLNSLHPTVHLDAVSLFCCINRWCFINRFSLTTLGRNRNRRRRCFCITDIVTQYKIKSKFLKIASSMAVARAVELIKYAWVPAQILHGYPN